MAGGMNPDGIAKAAIPSTASEAIFSGARKCPMVSNSLLGYKDTTITTVK